MPEMKHNQQCGRLGCSKKQHHWIASPDTCQCLNPPSEPFTSPWIHPCYNQPRVSRPKFRLETNSTVAWLYAGGVSTILPDVRFGMVSLDQVTYIGAWTVYTCSYIPDSLNFLPLVDWLHACEGIHKKQTVFVSEEYFLHELNVCPAIYL